MRVFFQGDRVEMPSKSPNIPRMTMKNFRAKNIASQRTIRSIMGKYLASKRGPHGLKARPSSFPYRVFTDEHKAQLKEAGISLEHAKRCLTAKNSTLINIRHSPCIQHLIQSKRSSTRKGPHTVVRSQSRTRSRSRSI